jgi:hypothetical protein
MMAQQEDGVNSMRTTAVRGAVLTAAAFLVSLSSYGGAQETPDSGPSHPATGAQDLEDQVRELRALVDQMRAENAESRAEMRQLREDLQATRTMLEHPSPGAGSRTAITAEQAPSQPKSAELASGAASPGSSGLEQRVEKLEESTSLIGAKIDEQYQTKVETASKYRARLHGIVLMNAFRNVGGSNNLDFPDFAQPVSHGSPQASFGATLRQSEIGLEIFGPNVAGARTSADVQLDFAGGFAATGNGVNFGILRLQTASLRFDWKNTSLVAGQDSLFISPLSPTSFASLAAPAFGFAGNLWAWTPELRVERRFSIADQQTVTLQAGILDNLDWEFPGDPFYRYPQASEQSGQPAYAARTSWSRSGRGRPLSFGAAGYYGRQNWNWDRYVDAWAGMADWQIPIAARLSLSGEFYRGRGIGGLGAGVGRSILYGARPSFAFAPIRGLDTAGGWTQLKVQVTPKIELNGVIAEDNSFTSDIRGFATDGNNSGPILGRNRGAFANVVFRPRSDLVFSAELRRLQSFPVYSSSSRTNQVGVSMGILF